MGMFLFILLLGGIAFVFYLNYFISWQFYEAARMKGHDSKKYLWIAFFFTVIGYLLVIALPNKNAVLSNDEDLNELPKL